MRLSSRLLLSLSLFLAALSGCSALSHSSPAVGWAEHDHNSYFAPRADGKICGSIQNDHVPYFAHTEEYKPGKSLDEAASSSGGIVGMQPEFLHEGGYLSLASAKQAVEGWCPR